MDDSADQFDSEDASTFIKAEAEINYNANGSFNSGSENCALENMDEEDGIQTSCRRSKRTRTRNQRYRTDEDNTIILTPNAFRINGKISDEEILEQEPSSSTSKRGTGFKHNDNKRKDNLNDPLGHVLTQIGLYDELYNFMKARGITSEALRYMQTRHIDELFKNTRLGTKIIFERRLRDWQNKNCEVTTTRSTYNKVNTQDEPTKLSQLRSSINHVLSEKHFENLSSLLTNAVQQTINTVIQEFKQSCQKQMKDKTNNSVLNNGTFPLRKIKTEPVDCATTEEIIIPDNTLRKIIRPIFNKPVKIADEFLLSNQSIDINLSQKPKKRKLDSDMSVREILTSSPTGQNLLIEYEKTGLITPNQRTELVRCIVDFCIRNNIVLSIVNCKEIAEELIEIFPTECVETYFIQDNKTRPPKGKLWDRYQSRKRSIRKLITLSSKNDSSPSDLEETLGKTDWSDMQVVCSQMKHINDERELLEKWRESFAFRRHQLQTGSFCNWKLYFDEYPFCKQQSYAQYIESDLETLYPNLKFNDLLWDEFLENFSTYFMNRIKHPKSKQLYDKLIAMENTSTSTDYLGIKVIELLHAVLKPPSNKQQSIEDAQRKFTVEVSDLSDLKKVVIERKKHCTENDIQAKPYIAVVGQHKNYTHFSVILDSTGFSCDNYKDSLILCFNLYLFFDISFPHESLNVWTFIQKYFFNKPPLVSNPRVETFINDIKGQKRVSLDVKTNMNEVK